MRNRVNQVYEKYWNYIAAFTDFEGSRFRGVLAACVEFIDAHRAEDYSPEKYKESWKFLQSRYPSLAKKEVDAWVTQRKIWNQLVKLGFVFPQLRGYSDECLDFLSSSNEMGRKLALSKVVYKYGNLNNSVTNKSPEWDGQLAFLIRTIEYNKCLSLFELWTIMNYDYNSENVSFLTAEDIRMLHNNQKSDDFFCRKYTQIRRLAHLLSKLLYIEFDGDSISYKSNISYEDIINRTT